MLTIRRKGDVLGLSLAFLLLLSGVTIGNPTQKSDYVSTSTEVYSIADYIPEDTWHHDCSNLTDFDGVGNDTWFADFGYNVTGTMNTSDSYIYADDYGFGSLGHGPLRYHTLSSPIRVSQFISLEAELELNGSETQLGHIMVILYDDFEKEVMTLHAAKVWDPYPTQVEALARWRFSNGTKIETPIDNVHPEPYHDTFKLSQNETGLFVSFPGIGNYSILTHNEIESNRVIKYIAIYLAATFSFSPPYILRVHDLLLSYDNTPPVIQGSDDIHYNEFTTGHSVIWNASESNPSTYSIFINGSPNSTGEWDGSDFTIDIDNHSLGVYNYTLLLTDVGGSVTSDTVLVFVKDGDAPVLTSPPDLEFEEGSSAHVITWVATDEHPEKYQILVNDKIQRSGFWNSTGESITASLDNMQSGIYNYTCCVYDAGNNTAWDVVFVNVTQVQITTTLTTTTTIEPTSGTTSTTSTSPTGTAPGLFGIDMQTLILVAGGIFVLIVCMIVRRRS